MNRIILMICAVVAAVSCFASTPSASTITSKAQLEERKKIGIYAFGDSVTHYLYNLRLLDNDKAGRLTCSVADYDRGFFRIGRYAPSTVRISTKNYLIKDMALYFGSEQQRDVESTLTELFGAPEEKDGTLFWYSPSFCIAARPEQLILYLVVINYVGL